MEKAGFSKKTVYFIKGSDKNGEFQITRTYKEFVLLREKLTLRWPGCFIPPMPTKSIGNKDLELIHIRSRFINNFLKKLGSLP